MNNGNDQLPEHRQRMVEAANAAFQAVAAERDDLARQLREMTLKYEGERMKLEHMDGIINLMESTIKTQQIKQDDAVANAAALTEALANIIMIADSHMIPKAVANTIGEPQ